MPIVASDIKIRLSVTTGTAGNTSTSSGPASLGKYISTTDVPTGTNQFFNTITGTENAGSVVKYRCFFVYNSHATLTLMSATVWLQGGDPAGGAAVTLAVDPTAASAVAATAAQALTAASETAPGASITGLTYAAPATAGTGLNLGDIGPGQVRAVWVRQAAQNTPAVQETITLAVTGSTLA